MKKNKDTYKLFENNNDPITIDEKNIVWPGDKGKKFKNSDSPNWRKKQWIDMEDGNDISFIQFD
jgi:hypothetical protein